MSFLKAKEPEIGPTPEPVAPAPQPIDVVQAAEQTEKAKRRRAAQGSTLLTRGLLSQEPRIYMPQLTSLLG